MNAKFYMLSMNIAGIKNIHNEIQIDFYGKNVNKNFNPDKYKIKGIYGENGSGKTAIITAVDIIRSYVLLSNYLQDSYSQELLKELINKESQKLKIRCEYVVCTEGIWIFEYEIHLAIDENRGIVSTYESLKYKSNSSKKPYSVIYICENGEFTELNANEKIKTFVQEKTRNLLSKQCAMALIIEECSKNKVVEDVIPTIVVAYVFFLTLVTHFDREDRHIHYYQNIKIKELKNKNLSAEKLLEEVSNSMPTNERKVPIKEYKDYEKRISQLEQFVRIFKPSLKKIDIEKRENKDYYECELVLDYGKYRVNKEFESTGIKKIMDMYDALKNASNGFIVFIDEMDSNINDIYLCKMIEYFNNYGEGQLCFTSHNLDPMAVLKKNSKAIDFLTNDNRIVPWIKNGNYAPDNSFRNGMIEGIPFNIDSTDFIGIFAEEK